MPKNFQNSTNALQIAHEDAPFDLIWDEQPAISASTGTIWIKSGLVRITYAGVCAVTLPAPDVDGQELTIISETAFAHTVTQSTPGYDNNSSNTVITMAPNVGDVIVLTSADGVWWIVKPAQSGNISQQVQVLSGDGAIAIKNGVVSITKGSAAAITIPVPTAGIDDGAELTISAETAFAHVVTQSTVGFNGKGSSGTLTWAAAKGNAVILHARNGNWWVDSNIGVTVA